MAPVVHFDDNYFIFVKTREELVPIAQTLRSEFNRHLAGPLPFSKCIIKDARRSFIALGYQFKVRGRQATIRVPEHKLNLCSVKFSALIMNAIHHGTTTREDAVRYIDRWLNGCRLWPHCRLWRALLIGRLDQHLPPADERTSHGR